MTEKQHPEPRSTAAGRALWARAHPAPKAAEPGPGTEPADDTVGSVDHGRELFARHHRQRGTGGAFDPDVWLGSDDA